MEDIPAILFRVQHHVQHLVQHLGHEVLASTPAPYYASCLTPQATLYGSHYTNSHLPFLLFPFTPSTTPSATLASPSIASMTHVARYLCTPLNTDVQYDHFFRMSHPHTLISMTAFIASFHAAATRRSFAPSDLAYPCTDQLYSVSTGHRLMAQLCTRGHHRVLFLGQALQSTGPTYLAQFTFYVYVVLRTNPDLSLFACLQM